MKHLLPRVATATALLVIAALSAAAYDPVPAPSSERHPLIGAAIQITEFQSSIPNDACGAGGCAKLVTDAVTESLRQRGIVAGPAGSVSNPNAVLEGEIMWLDEGNRASRYFYGGGASTVSLRGRVLDSYGRVIGSFEDSRQKTEGKFGGNSDDLLKLTVHAVAEVVADRIATGQY